MPLTAHRVNFRLTKIQWERYRATMKKVYRFSWTDLCILALDRLWENEGKPTFEPTFSEPPTPAAGRRDPDEDERAALMERSKLLRSRSKKVPPKKKKSR